MRLARLAAKVLMILVVFCETYVAWQLWRHGPPMDYGGHLGQSKRDW